MNRTRDAERSRAVILDAAAAVFAERGYEAASLQVIADRAGVSRATPAYFFGSKEGLYRAVLERAFADVREWVGRAEERVAGEAEDTRARQAIRAGIEAYFDFLVANPTFVRLVQWEALSGGAVLREVAPRLATLREQIALLDSALAGSPASFDPTDLLISIVALCWFPVAHRETLLATLGVDPGDPEFVARYRRHIGDLVLCGITRQE